MRECEFREALDDGRIICQKITDGNPEVDASICRRCPVMAINCQHLRFTLQKVGHKPILVRYGNGASEVWDEDPPAVDFVRGACAEKVMPVAGPRDCVGCRVRCPVREVRDVPARVAAERSVSEPAVAPAGNVIRFPALPPREEPAERVGGAQPDEADYGAAAQPQAAAR